MSMKSANQAKTLQQNNSSLHLNQFNQKPTTSWLDAGLVQPAIAGISASYLLYTIFASTKLLKRDEASILFGYYCAIISLISVIVFYLRVKLSNILGFRRGDLIYSILLLVVLGSYVAYSAGKFDNLEITDPDVTYGSIKVSAQSGQNNTTSAAKQGTTAKPAAVAATTTPKPATTKANDANRPRSGYPNMSNPTTVTESPQKVTRVQPSIKYTKKINVQGAQDGISVLPAIEIPAEIVTKQEGQTANSTIIGARAKRSDGSDQQETTTIESTGLVQEIKQNDVWYNVNEPQDDHKVNVIHRIMKTSDNRSRSAYATAVTVNQCIDKFKCSHPLHLMFQLHLMLCILYALCASACRALGIKSIVLVKANAISNNT